MYFFYYGKEIVDSNRKKNIEIKMQHKKRNKRKKDLIQCY